MISFFYCKPRWIKAEGTSTGNSLLPNSSRIYEYQSKCDYLNSIAAMRALPLFAPRVLCLAASAKDAFMPYTPQPPAARPL